MAQALGVPQGAYSSGRMTYDLRQLRLHGLIERTPHSYRYRVTDLGLRVALFFTKVHSRILRPGLSALLNGCPTAPNRPIATAMRRLQQAFADLFDQAQLAPTQI
jgi:predicted MarR family transcription regulator